MKKARTLLSIMLVLALMMVNVNFTSADSNIAEFSTENTIISLDDLEKIEDINNVTNTNQEINLLNLDNVINDLELSLDTEEPTASDNTDPNNAYLIPPDTTVGDTFAASGEQRWYAMEITERTKLSTILLNDTPLDGDLYIFKLNETTMQLEDYATSLTTGTGVMEATNNIVEAGIYYFAIYCYSGNGIFNFTVYTSTNDIDNEINDSIETAYEVTMSDVVDIQTARVEAVIDNPIDYDYYKITLPHDGLYQVMVFSPEGKEYQSLWSADGTDIYTVDDGIYELSQGVNYFGVRSLDGTYSNTDKYTFVVKEIKNHSFDEASYIGEWNDYTYSLYSDSLILAEKQNVGYFRFKVTPGHKLFIRISCSLFDDGMKAYLFDSNRNAIAMASNPDNAIEDGVLSFVPLDVNNTGGSTQTYYIAIVKPEAQQDKVYVQSVSLNDRIETGSKTFNFSGTASKSGSGHSSTLNIDLRNNSSIPIGAMFTDVETNGDQYPSQGGVYHEVQAYPGMWHRSIVSSSDWGRFNIPSDYVAQIWYFRFYTWATGSSTMSDVSISFDYEYDLGLNGYKRVN
ncbi:hypothetical protein SH1V18_40230 [Vallitalea longa]|uniref:Uncharacterized protein n=1 Tax=Vallitalea longa TaxID=2936439 RepID=A0A9W5YHW4_9FIRM|nr:hypothetical protein [Vallitalea longa]GKX31543.1 hypothetical protein SH1V18_40230 [Vallitalea longa]